MTYDEAIALAYAQLPVFHRDGHQAIRPGLANTIRFCEYLGNPHHQFKSIHIAGTNGKGSTSHMLAAILQRAGYKVGLYTSPHLKNFTERIRINGFEIERQRVADFIEKHQPEFRRLELSFFELTVGMAFNEFALQRVDIAVIETGLGGLLDSTNIITPELCIITNVSYDHMDVLGSSLEAIAAQKAGIIKPNIPVVLSQRDETVLNVIQEAAQQQQAPLYIASSRFVVQNYTTNEGKLHITVHDTLIQQEPESFHLELIGLYQRFNLPGVLQAVEVMKQNGFVINREHIREGLMNTVSLTGLKGRWQQIGENPLIYCDTGHNEAGLSSILECIWSIPHRQLWIIFGCARDKDVNQLLQLLPHQAKYLFSQANSPRAMSCIALRSLALNFHLDGFAINNVNDALNYAKQKAQPEDLIVVCGSTYLVAEINNL